MTETTTLYCYVHPNRATTLRCNRCERPICAQCAIRTPTGYRCRECVKEQQKTFNTALWYDYLIGLVVVAVLSMVASGIVAALSFLGIYLLLIIAFFGAAGAGALIANIALRIVSKRRSRALFITMAAGVVLGALPVTLIGFFFFGGFFSLIGQVIYVVVATPTVYARIAGIQL